MYNVMKMDLYRMLKMKSTWIILLILGAFTLFYTYSLNLSLELLEQMGANNVNLYGENGATVSMNSIGFTSDTITFLDIFSSGLSGLLVALFSAIFCVIFVNGDQKTGFLKNIIAQVSGKWSMIFSKLFSILVYTVIMFVVSGLSSALGMWIFFGQFDSGELSQLFSYIAMQLLLHLAFGALVMLITVITRNSAVSMVFGIGFATGFLNLLFAGISTIISKYMLDGKAFQITDYLITGNMSRVSPQYNAEVYICAAIVSAVFLIISFAVSTLILQRRDVK